MAISRRRLAENLKEMHGIKKRHVKGVQNFCFCHLSGMQILWRRRCSRVVDLKLPDVQENLSLKSLSKFKFLCSFFTTYGRGGFATLKEKHVRLSKQNENFGVFENTLTEGQLNSSRRISLL